jgi:hypothetical protein
MRLSENAEGYARWLWRQGPGTDEVRERPRRRADRLGARRRAQPARLRSVRGRRNPAIPFSPRRPAYKRLVATPGLRATVVVDRAGLILNVRFHGRSQP